MASLGIAIMAVPERRAAVERLLATLGLGAEIVVWDHTHKGHILTWWRAAAQASADLPSHVLILEDDAIPAKDLLLAVQQLITQYPDRLFSLYSNLRSVDAARAQGQHLLACYQLLSDVAVVYPRQWLDELRVDYQPRAKEFSNLGADEMRQKLRPKQRIWVTVPSLVQHGQPFQSTLGHRHPRQVARWFIGEYTSALSVDWSQA